MRTSTFLSQFLLRVYIDKEVSLSGVLFRVSYSLSEQTLIPIALYRPLIPHEF